MLDVNKAICRVFPIIMLLLQEPSPTATIARNLSQQPNIVFILADDLGYRDIGYQDSDIVTPTLDHLANTGLKLDNYYVQQTCAPTRNTLMTGRYEIHMGVQHETLDACETGGLPLGYPTMGDILRDAGYATHYIGKWHLGFFKKEYTPLYRGFDTFFGNLPGYSYHFSYNTCTDSLPMKACGYGLLDGELPYLDAYGNYSTEVYTDRAVQVLKNAAREDKPFFMSLNYQAPHYPIEAPKHYSSKYKNIANSERRIYAGMVSAIDEGVRVIMDTLGEMEMLNNTVVIFSSDNGAEVSLGSSNWPLRGTKSTYWEGGIRTVGFVHSPLLAAEQQGGVSRELMHCTDWLPTFAEIAGVELDDSLGFDGVSQWTMLRDGASSPRDEILFGIDIATPRPEPSGTFSHTFDPRVRAALRKGRYKLLTGDPGDGRWFPVPTEYTLASMASQEQWEENNQTIWLFDILTDPNELTDLSAELPETVLDMLNSLDAYDKTALPAVESYIDPRCNPERHRGFWEPWLD